jgi:hypothetical protein
VKPEREREREKKKAPFSLCSAATYDKMVIKHDGRHRPSELIMIDRNVRISLRSSIANALYL